VTRTTGTNGCGIDRADEEAVGAFLRLLADDIASGRNIGDLPDDLMATLRDVLAEVAIDLDEPITGEVQL
jgi:hypothetical protein